MSQFLNYISLVYLIQFFNSLENSLTKELTPFTPRKSTNKLRYKRDINLNHYSCLWKLILLFACRSKAFSFKTNIIKSFNFVSYQRFQCYRASGISQSILHLFWRFPKYYQSCASVQNSDWTPSWWVYRLTRSLGYLKYLHHSVPNPSRAFNQLKLPATLRLPGAV